MDKIIFQVEKENTGIRIDKYLSDNMENISRSYLQKLLKDKSITVNNKAIKANYKVQEGDMVSVSVPEPEEPDILPEEIPLDILYEDDSLMVVNKPKDMVVHPSAGHTSGTLVNAVLFLIASMVKF